MNEGGFVGGGVCLVGGGGCGGGGYYLEKAYTKLMNDYGEERV